LSHSGSQFTTGTESALLSLARLDRLDPDRSLPGRNRTKADILKYEVDGRGVALKDYRGRPAWIRATLGRYLIRKESLGYRWAGTVEGLPRFLGRLGPVTLATEWIDAVPLARVAGERRFRDRPSVLRPFRRWLFGHLCRLDRIAAARMRARFTGGDADEAVERAGGGTSRLYRAGRKLKAILHGRRK
jgi:hypothetical protein